MSVAVLLGLLKEGAPMNTHLTKDGPNAPSFSLLVRKPYNLVFGILDLLHNTIKN